MVFAEFVVLGKEFSFTVYVRGAGRITIPKQIRDALSIKEGDLILCKVSKVRVTK